MKQKFQRFTTFKENRFTRIHFIRWKKVCLYNSGNGAKSILGVGIITTENKNVTFNPASERICIITANTSENVKSHLISAFAPTLENTARNPDETHIF